MISADVVMVIMLALAFALLLSWWFSRRWDGGGRAGSADRAAPRGTEMEMSVV